ncbi:uncharacterized protein DSM5745_06871 [Aspergillus mulundensis]|uniref:Uncharacterized protein n=1 Tax=Aspergillus mulundensis TaxID=1810919 RepID=A0A3D8RS61_9EURO|nr:hypothetical protein DSM5745_06871 [Aspergillus mulundensis]RDW76879.1 hypothetical protein DSM5745_06871 [Aspergillus mulundensis]
MSSFSSTWSSIVTRYPPAAIEVTGSALLQLTILLSYFLKSFYSRPTARAALLRCLPLAITNICLATTSHASFLYTVSRIRGVPFTQTSLSTVSSTMPTWTQLLSGFAQGALYFDIRASPLRGECVAGCVLQPPRGIRAGQLWQRGAAFGVHARACPESVCHGCVVAGHCVSYT